MASAVKLNIVIPASRRVEFTLPENLPPGPAEVIVFSASEEKENRTLRPLGLDVGKGWVADDFDAPLPDDLQQLFEGGS